MEADQTAPVYFVQVRSASMDGWITHAIATNWASAAVGADRLLTGLRDFAPVGGTICRVMTAGQIEREAGTDGVAEAVVSFELQARRAARWLQVESQESSGRSAPVGTFSG